MQNEIELKIIAYLILIPEFISISTPLICEDTFVKKRTVSDHTCAVFRRMQATTALYTKWHRSRNISKKHKHAPQRKPPDTTILNTFAISKLF